MLHAERLSFRETLHSLRPRPDSGNTWLDIFWVLALAAIERVPLDDLTGRLGVVDVITPWLVVGGVSMIPSRFIALALIAGLARETHSTAPMGLYCAINLVVALTMILARDSMSWRHATPWLATIALALALSGIAEFFAFLLVQDISSVTPSLLAGAALRIPVGTLFGLWLCRSRLSLIPDPPPANAAEESPR